MSDFFIGEIRAFSYGKNPQYWLPCDGRLLQIVQNSALYSLLGTQFGGDGRTTFALPDLRGVAAAGRNSTLIEGAINFTKYGQKAGEVTHQLTASEVPSHSHAAQASSLDGGNTNIAGNLWAAGDSTDNVYAAISDPAVPMYGAAVDAVGGAAHNNMQPYLAVNYCIAIMGIYPSRS